MCVGSFSLLLQPKAKFNACHFLQYNRFTNSVSSFLIVAYVGDGPFLAKKKKKWICDNLYFSPEELRNGKQHPIKHMGL